ncbi:MAG: hypothetical protein AABZ10_07940 [Nitrospirota bacterium]
MFVLERDGDGDGVPDLEDACPLENATGFDADHDGRIDSLSRLTEVVGTLVQEGMIDAQMENSLASKVANAEKSAEKDQICTAVNDLAAGQRTAGQEDFH